MKKNKFVIAGLTRLGITKGEKYRIISEYEDSYFIKNDEGYYDFIYKNEAEKVY